jgi:asparagine synthase (glutamine-hydrolysing)
MCGICGLVSRHLEPDEMRRAIARMTRSLRHRGPDGEGTQVFAPTAHAAGVALGHTRLAIIDLSEAGLQPLRNEDESIWVDFNGEIYNFLELRSELEQRGHQFRSNGDSEVIVHLYEEEGPACVERLNGMFALALYDAKESRVVLARDRLGIKPLYYAMRAGTFLFGSEIKAILAADVVPVEVNWQAASDYLTYLYVPCPQTIFRDIVQLPPAHRLVADLQKNQFRLEAYWHVRNLPEIQSANSNDLRTCARELVTDSVRRQLVADVPVGVFLSGGIDSSIVAGTARKEDASLRSFTVLFEGEEFSAYNEQETSRAASRHLGTDHRELTVPNAAPERLLELVEYFDQPFGNPTSFLMYEISKAAREHIKVALCGAGGDELYAGYPRYRAAALAARLRGIPRGLLRLCEGALGLIRDASYTHQLRRARKFLAGLNDDPVTQFIQWTYFFNDREKQSLIHLPAVEGSSAGGAFLPSERFIREALQRSELSDVRNRYLEADVRTFLVDNVLEYTDKMSMAVPLEVRVPLLDHRFVEFSLNVPFNEKLRRGQSKILLRESFADFLSPEVINAPKRGFNAPLAHWMTRYFDSYFDAGPKTGGRWGEDAGETWREGIFDKQFIQELREDHRRGRRDNSYPLFGLIMFDIWWRKYIKASLPAPHVAA